MDINRKLDELGIKNGGDVRVLLGADENNTEWRLAYRDTNSLYYQDGSLVPNIYVIDIIKY